MCLDSQTPSAGSGAHTREAEVPQRLSRALVCNFRTRERMVGVRRAQGKNHGGVGGAGLRDRQARELDSVG